MIKRLDENISNMIAAGEVVENPASMIKELLENSLDAKAKNILIEVDDFTNYVHISDDGIGMDKEDIKLSIEKHTTSKISNKEDIFNIRTYGFRGEALSSIASVSKMNISSRYIKEDMGYKMNVYGGDIVSFESLSRNIGTDIEVRDLFYTAPARKKFLKKKVTEYNKIKDIVLKIALGNYNVAITLLLDNKTVIKTTGNGIENTIFELFGKNILKNMNKFEYGYICNSEILKNSREYIFTFVNNRYVKSPIIDKAVIDAYYTKLMKGKYPFAIIFLDIDPIDVDVNVHPSKKYIKFTDDSDIYITIKRGITEYFYIKERENWQPKIIDNIKNTPIINMEEKKIFNIMDDPNELNKSKTFIADIIQEDNIVVIKEDENEDNKRKLLKEYTKKIYEDPFKDYEEYEKKLNVSEPDAEYFKGIFDNTKTDINYFIIGQIFDTYILVKRNNKLEIYDQHIIHERVLYEELKLKYNNIKMKTQALLLPEVIELTPLDKDIVIQNINVFIDFGFDIQEFSDKEILVRGVPEFNFRNSLINVINDIIDDIKNKNQVRDIREKVIISMSCRGAIKAGQRLSMEEMEKMVRKLHEVGKYTCPHGRPIIVELSKYDLDKMFGRVK